MHPFSILTLGIFVAGYITARWDLVTRLYELAIFAWDYGVVVSSMLRHTWPAPPSSEGLPVLTRVVQSLVSCRQGVCHTISPLRSRPHTCGTLGHERVNFGTTTPHSITRVHTDSPRSSTPDRPDQAYLHENS